MMFRAQSIFSGHESIAPLVIFRMLFGILMALSTIRFAAKGWISELYIEPRYFFTFYGFEWVKPLPGIGMYFVFALIFISAVTIALGWRYRLSAIVFFLSFTYVELIDKTNYLNHYYAISLVSFLLIFMPAHRRFSIDSHRNPKLFSGQTPSWAPFLLKFQLGVVYFFAGVAKLNADWLLEAQPLKIWLPAKSNLPLIGSILEEPWAAYLLSWGGALYDLLIVFFLLWAKSRPIAYGFVVVFHVLTYLLFPGIGMFPFIMVGLTLIYFSADFHEKVLGKLEDLFSIQPPVQQPGSSSQALTGVWRMAVVLFVSWQLLMPMRYVLYPGPLFWREEGYRFSWRVMLMEKAGTVTFHVHDQASGRKGQVAAYEYLTPQQEKMMATQPDMILQFAHFLAEELKRKGLVDPEIRAESAVSLNGRRSRPLIDPTVNLVRQQESFSPKTWILPAE
ncbi:HTTM domain-containing protein [uncultured Imperialibacter sp.]|uniref:HTTM domain-containing protein n=1 Tax=uncultured Imperialibacter sp. TaxID=1672639 RepID=UPI0030D882C4|tara:strand:- start:90402 stop:91745 length:1344 start_codon:yes stop_codon:yes gene_type:complete